MSDDPMARSNAVGSLWSKLYHGQTNFEFVRRWKLWAVISGTVILIGLASLFTRGLTLGIDFKGGTAWELPRNSLSVANARDTVGPVIGRGVTIQTLGNDRLRIKGPKTEATTRDKVSGLLAKAAKIDRSKVDVTFVGPSWGKDVTNKARKALIVFFFVIAAFISIRFEWKMAAAAILAVVHDILVTVGVYSLSGFEVTPATVIAFLTILGYSLYDTIVVFDKVKENVKSFGGSARLTYTDIVNLSMNQVLARSLNTSFVAILPILSMLVFGAGLLGATALGDFGLALFIGLLTGAYSSIFVASPLLALFKEREERWAQIAKRLGHGSVGLTADAAAAARTSVATVTGTVNAADNSAILRPGAGAAFPGVAPRPRKQGKVR